jgi:hypothetical protein
MRSKAPEVKIPLSGATPTLTVDGRIVMVDRDDGVTVIDPSRRRVINSVVPTRPAPPQLSRNPDVLKGGGSGTQDPVRVSAD